MNTTWHDPIRTVFRQKRLVISAELFVFALLRAFELVGLPTNLVLFPLGWISLRLRRIGWREVGLRRPTSWLRVLGLGALIGMIYQLIGIWLISPLVEWLAREPSDLSQFASIRGSIPNLVAYIIFVWLLGAFLEEMVYRGYLINRFTGLFGDNRASWTIGILVSSALFAIGHINMGVASVLESFVFALVFAGLYLAARHNLWLPIIAHGFHNTLGLVLIYLGLYS